MTHYVHHVNIIDLHKAIVKKYKVMAEGLQPQPISLPYHTIQGFYIYFISFIIEPIKHRHHIT